MNEINFLEKLTKDFEARITKRISNELKKQSEVTLKTKKARYLRKRYCFSCTSNEITL